MGHPFSLIKGLPVLYCKGSFHRVDCPCIIYFRLLGESHVRQITKPTCELYGDTHVFCKPIIGQEESSVSLYSEALVVVCDNCLLLQAEPVSMQSFLGLYTMHTL